MTPDYMALHVKASHNAVQICDISMVTILTMNDRGVCVKKSEIRVTNRLPSTQSNWLYKYWIFFYTSLPLSF